MRIVCPECHAAYKVGAIIKNAILVCHRCQTEFDTMGNRIVEDNETAKIFKAQEEAAPTFGISDLLQSGMQSKKDHIWIFMILVLIVISASGIAMRWQHWQYNSFVRAIQMEVSPTTPILDRDWLIIPDSIHSQWLTRADQSLVLWIEGRVQNLVTSSLPAPEIKITFVTQTGKNVEVVQAITEPGDINAYQAVPFVSPPVDEIPVPAQGTRGFILLIEDAPHSTQHILLHALAVQKKGATTL